MIPWSRVIADGDAGGHHDLLDPAPASPLFRGDLGDLYDLLDPTLTSLTAILVALTTI